MMIWRFLGVFILSALSVSCTSISGTSPSAPSGNPEAASCQSPGTPQPTVCHYRLIVKHIQGHVFEGHVDPQVVRLSEQYCHDAQRDTMPSENSGVFTKEHPCQNAESYQYVPYTFEIEGEQPTDGEAVELVNIPNTTRLKKGGVSPQRDQFGGRRMSDLDTSKTQSN